MTLRNVRYLFVSSLTSLLLAAGCFLVIGDIPEGSGDGTGGDASSNGGSGGISGGSGESGGAGMAGAAGSAGTGASAGDGGVAGIAGASGSAGSAGGSGAGGGGGSGGGSCINPPCDCDDDGYVSVFCSQGDDCDDTDVLAHPGQAGWFSEKRNDGAGFDYNCDGNEDREFPEVTCGDLTSLLCGQQPTGFHAPAPPCGQAGSYGKCKYQGIQCVNDPTDLGKIVRCH